MSLMSFVMFFFFFRLSQGHARLMFHNEVEVIDSVYAVVLIDTAMDVSSILNLNISTRTTFPDCPTKDYCDLLENVLNKLDLQDIFQKETAIMGKNRILESVYQTSIFFNVQASEQNGNSFTSNPEKKRKTVGNSHESVEKVKKINENYDVVTSEFFVKGYNMEDKDSNPKKIKNDVIIDSLSLSTEDSKTTETSSKMCKEDLYRKGSSQSFTANNRDTDCGIKNVVSYEEEKNEETEDHDISNSNKTKGQDKVHGNSANNFLKDDLKMLMLIPNVNENFDIDLDLDMDNLIK